MLSCHRKEQRSLNKETHNQGKGVSIEPGAKLNRGEGSLFCAELLCDLPHICAFLSYLKQK